MSLMRSILEKVASLLPQPRVIRDRSDASPYLSRWYLLGKPWMPDGSSPFDESGQTREGMKWSRLGLGVYLHKFHRDDESDELHNHPWKAAVAFVLAGGYVEERRAEIWDPLDERGAQYVVEKRVVRPGTVNVITGDDFHRVDLIEKDSWSLFVTWKKEQSWGFWDRHTNKFTPWREYLEEWRAVRSAVYEDVRKSLEGFVGKAHTSFTAKEIVEALNERLGGMDFDFLRDHQVRSYDVFPEGYPDAAPTHVVDKFTVEPRSKGEVHRMVKPNVPNEFVSFVVGGTLPREGEEDAGQVEKSDGGKSPQEG